MDEEYAISYYDRKGVLHEVGMGVFTLNEAQKEAKWYIRNGASEVVIKYYADGDLKHQWDYKNGNWVRYE